MTRLIDCVFSFFIAFLCVLFIFPPVIIACLTLKIAAWTVGEGWVEIHARTKDADGMYCERIW